jgi:plastocyanin
MRAVKKLTLVGLALGLGLAPALVGAVTPAGAQTGGKEQARIVSFAFDPAERSIPVGTTITWTNNSDRPHTVTDRGGTFDTNPIAPKATGEVTFSAPGVYHYFCRINPSRMNGTITVTGDTAQASVNRIEAIDPAAQFTGERLRFVPNELTVKAGSTLQLANVGAKPHSLTADDGSFDTGIVTPGAEAGRFAGTNASITLKAPGTFRFHCEVHPQAMTGTLTVTGAAPSKPGPSPPSDAARQVSVDTVDFEFKPGQASVAPGGEVTWKNNGAAPHTATFDDVSLDTGNITPGSSAKLTAPDRPGSYSYKCKIHPGKMRGVLVVVGQNQADPTQLAAAKANGPPAAAAGASGAGRGISAFALVTGVIGAFLGGFGISAFVRPRRAAPAPPAA